MTYDPVDYDDDLLNYNTYHYGKAGHSTLTTELTETFQGTTKIALEHFDEVEEAYDVLYHSWKTYVGPSDPLPWEEVIMSKDPNTSLGYPLAYDYGTMEELLEDITMEELSEIFQSYEDTLLEGFLPPATWRPFPKMDKYSGKKVMSSKFRLVSVGNVFFLALCKRWFSQVVTALEEAVDQFYINTGPEIFNRKFVMRMLNAYSWGVDYTAFDKNSTAMFTLLGFKLLHRLSCQSTPKFIYEYIALNIAQPLSIIVSPDRTLQCYLLCSSNPSGQFFTSYTNSCTHLVHNLLFSMIYLGESGYDYIADRGQLRSIMTGDDGVDLAETEAKAVKISSEMCRFVEEFFNIPAKLEFMEDESGRNVPFPPGISPVYLNKVYVVKDDGTSYLIPSNLRRLLPRLMFVQPSDVKGTLRETLQERVIGILQEVQPTLLHEYFHPCYPKNVIAAKIVEKARSLGVLAKSPHNTVSSLVLPRVDKLI